MKVSHRYRLLGYLADGRFYSGSLLGERLGISRAAVWKYMRNLKELGFEVYSIPGKGYRLAEPVELLNQSVIEQYLGSTICGGVMLEVLDEVASTNTYLMEQSMRSITPRVCLTEYQSQGRGRHGRQWVTPYAGGLACSLLWRFDCPAGQLSGLSLAVGLSVVRALEALGVSQIKLKWPNDIFCNDYKLGGILIEIAGDAAGPCYCVIGVGLNVNLRRAQLQMAEVAQPWTDLARLMPDALPSRNQLAALLIQNLLDLFPTFALEGFAAFQQDWNRYDLLQGRTVSVQAYEGEIVGVARGVNSAGNFLLEVDTQQLVVTSGEVTVRPR